LPFVRELCLKYQNIDPVHELVPVRPVIHYMMGGVSTDIDGATPLEGLFAAGEVACVSINGANRLGSNSLPECLVFGARAGRAAARFAQDEKAPNGKIMAQAIDEQTRLEAQFLHKTGGRERIASIREEMQNSVESGAGIYRQRATLIESAGKLHELQERFRNIRLDDHSRTFNTELVSALELECMLDVAETIVQCALHRTESRGAHQRMDFPERDDQKFLAHSLAYLQPDGSSRIEYAPVKITRWAPGERVYGQKPAEPSQTISAHRGS
jgi:fumarate reductase flavoprotein subunit